MKRVATFMVRHARLVLVLWLVAFGVALAFAGVAQDNIHQPSLRVPGSPSAKAADLTTREFGGTISMAVLLKGPPAAVKGSARAWGTARRYLASSLQRNSPSRNAAGSSIGGGVSGVELSGGESFPGRSESGRFQAVGLLPAQPPSQGNWWAYFPQLRNLAIRRQRGKQLCQENRRPVPYSRLRWL